jgi:hypothetical protein
MENKENPVNNHNRPAQLAKNAVGPYISLFSEGTNSISLKNMVSLVM